jgi:hypothetical protein
MSSKCESCRHWQGTKCSEWGDCHYIIAVIAPWVLEWKNLFGFHLTVPFDPHDVKYFDGLNQRLLWIGQKDLMDKVRYTHRREQDIKFILSQYDGLIIGERTAPRKIVYFQTHQDKKGCRYYE